MLVLTRGQGQSVVLDERITVTVLASRGGTVRLGIEAPPEVGVRRGELTAVLRRAPAPMLIAVAPSAGGRAVGDAAGPDR
jgi:carbon storage regulator